MKASELRIKNWVIIRGKECQIKNSIEYDYDYNDWFVDSTFLKLVKPIPLTEKRLIKFGFDYKAKNDEVRWYNYSSNYSFEIYEIKGKFYPDSCEENGAEIEFVHQLQNSYFEWTREELTIKQ